MPPAELAAAALRVPLDEIVAVERIKHGLTNESFLVRSHSEVVVVRISVSDEDALRIDRASEAQILALAAEAGIGAPVLMCDPGQRVLVTRYLGPSWSQADAAGESNIRRLACLLRRLHQLNAPSGARAVELGETISGYLRTLDLQGAGGGLTRRTLRERAHAAAATVRRHCVARLCHNDVHHLNIVDGGELRLIDWEYAGSGEPLFDLASACVYHRYDAAQRAALVSAYAQPGNLVQEGRFELTLWLFEYIRDLWTAVRSLPQAQLHAQPNFDLRALLQDRAE